MSDIKKGDVVQLKSGGPQMTVQDIDDFSPGATGKKEALCVWFDGKKPLTQSFELDVLKTELK